MSVARGFRILFPSTRSAAGRRLAEGLSERPGKSLLSPLPHAESCGGGRSALSSAVLAHLPPGGPGAAPVWPCRKDVPLPSPSAGSEKLCISPVSPPGSPFLLALPTSHTVVGGCRRTCRLPSGSGSSALPRPWWRGGQVWTRLASHVPPTGTQNDPAASAPQWGSCSEGGAGLPWGHLPDLQSGGLWQPPSTSCPSEDAPVLTEAGLPGAAVVPKEGISCDGDQGTEGVQGTEGHSGDRHRKLKEKHWSGDQGAALPSRKPPRVRDSRAGGHPRPSVRRGVGP